MTTITLETLGRAELRSGTSEFGAHIPMQPKRLALLAYLALTSGQAPQSRDRLVSYFWPEAGPDEARAALRQALHHLRQRLSDAALISTPDGRVALEPSLLNCDAVELERAAAKGDHPRALALYRGEFLDGLLPRDTAPEFEEWIDRTRRHLRALAANAAEQVVRGAVQERRLDEAIAASARWTEIAPDNEEALRTQLELLEQRGRTGDAITFAERAMREFEARLGVPLAAETLALVAAIRARRNAQASVPPVQDATATTGVANALVNTVPPRPDSVAVAQHENTAPSIRSDTVVVDNRKPRSNVLAAAVAGVAIVFAVAFVLTRSGAFASNAQNVALQGASTTSNPPADRLLVADFKDAGDGLGAAVASALRVDLAQPRGVRVLTGAQVREAARRSQLSDELSLDDSLVRTIAVREGLKAIVTGDIHRVANQWLLTARLVNARDGNALVSVRETAQDSSDLISAIEKLSRALTARAYTALATQPAGVPLARVTTSSLPALRAYSEALRLLDDGERMRGITRMQQAVDIDSGFATAWRILGSSWAALDEPAKAQHALRRAFAHRDRLAFRERYLLEGSYHRTVTRNLAAAVASYRTLLAAYPDDLAAMNNLALVYVSMGIHVQAESLFRRVIAADSTLVHAYLTMAEQVAMQGRHDDAARIMDDATRRFPDHPVVRLTPIYLASAAQQWARAESVATARLSNGVGGIQRVDALQTLARIEMVRGGVKSAEAHLAQSMNEALQAKSPYRYLSGAITSAWLYLRYHGDAAKARTTLERALKRVPMATVPEADRPTAALIAVMLSLRMNAAAEELAGGPEALRISPAERAGVQGLFSYASGRSAQAAAQLAAAADSMRECAMCLLPALARARAAAGDVAGAIRAAEDYLSAPYILRFEPDAAELPELLTGLAGWYESRGDVVHATETWKRLLELWSQADGTVASRVADARRHVVSAGGR